MSELDGLKLLRRVEEGVAGKTGEAFFNQIVCDIAQALGAHGAFTSRLIPNRRARMLSFWLNGKYEKCNTYSLQGSPCEYVYNGAVTAYSRDISELFPAEKEWFDKLGVKSYLGVPVRDEHGTPFGHLAVMDTRERDWHEADVDVLRLYGLRLAAELERSRYERELLEANQKLQSEIETRIAAEQQLAAAKIAAEAANQAKSAFISQMSHELRTPLNGILGYAQLLKQDAAQLAPRQLDGVNIIERSGEHLLNLVNDLLDLAKIEAGKLELHPTEVDLRELLRHVADLARVRAEHVGLQFAFELATIPSYVNVDARALRQVLLNLLGNAVKFTHAGNVSLHVSSELLEAKCHRIRFSIADSGVGISAEQLPRIFEPFHRVTDSGRVVEGTGLGLAITQRLVAEMGGNIDVTSDLNKGSTFTVTLPVEALQNADSTQITAMQVSGYEGARKSVIVADDDEVNRSLLAQLLESLGFEVKRATNGLEALQLFRSAPTDLVITDLVMPVIDGIELAQTLRQSLQSTVPLIALSASASRSTQQEALQAGCNSFASKPVRFAPLLDEIGQLLQIKWRRVAVANPRSDEAPVTSVALSSSAAQELYHLAMQGDVTALLARAEQTLGADPQNRSLYKEIRSLAEQYDMGALRRILSQQGGAS